MSDAADPIKVLVVDDSAFARKVLREVLTASAGLKVVGIARDGLDALEKIAELAPDVVTLDLAMPGLDGVGVLEALRGYENPPRVVVVTISDDQSDVAVAALAAGAVDLVRKPTALATDRLYELAGELADKVRTAAGARARPTAPATAPPPAASTSPRRPDDGARPQIVVVGASTGGPQALHRLLTALPADMPVPVALVLHIPPGYTEALAKRLDGASAIHVVEASEGLPFEPGVAVVARAGMHLKMRRDDAHGRARLDVRPIEALHRPSVDVLFESAAAAFGPRVLAVVLTGMGDDGLAGARAVRAAGGTVLTEAESTCVVYGMPRTVAEAGLSNAAVPLDEMAAEILKRI